jgi:CheY-like chemotaxis protein
MNSERNDPDERPLTAASRPHTDARSPRRQAGRRGGVQATERDQHDIRYMPKQATVLIVDDERPITDAYAQWLEGEYAVRSANSGREALEQLDESIDIVLLDRRMPGMSGEEVLDVINDRGLDCRVVLVTAVEPDFDILDLGLDAYLEKPVSEPDELLGTVERLLRRSTYDSQMREFLSLASKKAALETKKSPAELDASPEYDSLQRELVDLRGELSNTTGALDDQDLRADFRNRLT